MMIIVHLVALILNIILLIIVARNYLGIKKIYENTHKKNTSEETLKREELLEDLVDFTINSGFECMIMPDINGKNTLFIKGEKNEVMPIITIPSTNSKKGSEEYNFLLDQSKKEIEKFKELLNAKN